jgi:hypothetical protein
MSLKEIAELQSATYYTTVNDTNFIIVPLMFHVSILVEPTACGGYEDRYCMYNTGIAKKAIEEYQQTNQIKYWQKHHNKGISIACDNLAFNDGVFQIKGNELYSVEWNLKEIKAKYLL